MTNQFKELDPVQGLVDYIEDIKPYHTKVIEILTEYVYNEAIDTTITDLLHLKVDLIYPGPADAQETFDILCGFGQQPYDGFTSWPVIAPNITLSAGPFVAVPLGYDLAADTIIIPGDRTGQYLIGSDIEVDLYAYDTVLDTRTVGVQTQYTIVDISFTSFGQTGGQPDTPHTTITVSALVDPAVAIPPLGGDEVYAAGVNLIGLAIDSVVGYSNAAPVFYLDVPPGADPLPTPTIGSLPQSPDENPGALVFSNSFVFVGDFSTFFSQGFKFEVVGGTTEGFWTVKYSYYDSGSGNTYVRVIEHINTVGFVTGDANERFFGYDNTCIDQTNIPIGLTSTEFVEGFVLSWYDDIDGADVIDGCQFQIKDGIVGAPNSFLVNGDATADIVNGQVIRVNGSPTNDGTYTVSSPPTYDGQFTDIEVAESPANTEVGGWLECTNLTPAVGPFPLPAPPGTLALSTVFQNVTSFGTNQSSVGIRITANGIFAYSAEASLTPFWNDINFGTEWVDDSGASAAQFEAQLVALNVGSLTNPVWTGWSGFNEWQPCNQTLALEDYNTDAAPSAHGYIVQLEIREIANIANIVVDTIEQNATNDP